MKAKTFILGLILGSLLAVTVSVAAANREAQVLLVDDFKITIDGQQLDIPEEYEIINYNNRVYTPVRVIAEAMDGDVEFDANTNTAKITKPTPAPVPTPEPTPEPEPEETPEPTPTPTPTPAAKTYIEAPGKLKKDDVTVNVFGLSSSSTGAYLTFDIKNENAYPLMLDINNAYIESDGNKFPADIGQNFQWFDSIRSGAELEDQFLVFNGDIKSAKKISIYLPFTLQRSLLGGKDTTITFSMNIDFE